MRLFNAQLGVTPLEIHTDVCQAKKNYNIFRCFDTDNEWDGQCTWRIEHTVFAVMLHGNYKTRICIVLQDLITHIYWRTTLTL